MRSTQLMRAAIAQTGIEKNSELLLKYQKQLATGRKVTTVSDDPLITYQSLVLRKDVSRNNGYIRGIENIMPSVQLTQNSLNSMQDSLRSFKTLMSQTLNTTYSDPNTLSNLAQQADSILNNLIIMSNSRIGGNYIFSGHNTTSETLTLDSANNRIIFNGTGDKVAVQIDRNLTQDATLTGDELFRTNKIQSSVGFRSTTTALSSILGAAPASGAFSIQVGDDAVRQINGFDESTGSLTDLRDAINNTASLNVQAKIVENNGSYYLKLSSKVLGEDGAITMTDGMANGILTKVGLADSAGTLTGSVVETATGGSLDTLIKVKNMMSSGAINAATMTTYIQEVDDVYNRLLEKNALAGTYEQRLNQVKSLKDDLNLSYTELTSQIEDVDFADVATKLSLQETSYQAALSIATRIQKLSILNYM